jgi:hypothetical protein
VSWVLSGCVVAVLATSCGESVNTGHPAPATMGGGGNGAGAAGEAAAGEAGASAGQSAPVPGSREPDATLGGPRLGLPCKANADCGDPLLRCLTSNEGYVDGQGSPGGGLCTADCASDEQCRVFDVHAVCATLGESPLILEYSQKPVQRLCMEGCSFGAPTGDTKCHGRQDLACRPFAPYPFTLCFDKDAVCPSGTACFRGVCREAACGPRCNQDADCSAGRSCNPFTGLCDEQPVVKVPIGAECPGEGEPASTICGGGNCLEVQAGGKHVKRMCTQSCTVGQLCGDDGACVFGRLEDFAAGDAGYCEQRCDCDSDCRHPADKCFPWVSDALAQHFKSQGYCDYAPAGAKSLTCGVGEGGAGAGGQGGADAGGQGGAGAVTSGGATDLAGQGGN